MSKSKVHLLNYVAGNIRSLVNAIEKVGYEVEWVRKPEDVQYAEVSRCLIDLSERRTEQETSCSNIIRTNNGGLSNHNS